MIFVIQNFKICCIQPYYGYIVERKFYKKLELALKGILSKDTLMQDGFKRSTSSYGILREEWSDIKKLF